MRALIINKVECPVFFTYYGNCRNEKAAKMIQEGWYTTKPNFMWREEDNKLKKTFRFPDFKTAFAFMTKVAAVAEEIDHHPWWSNVYNVVHFELYTHDAGNTVTRRDHKLAQRIDEIAQQYS